MPGIDARVLRLLCLVASAAVAGCAGEPATVETSAIAVEARSATDRDLPWRPWLPEVNAVQGHESRADFAASITMKQAIAHAVDASPAVKAAFLEIEARHGEAAQASYKPNPELSLDVENFFGSGAKSGFNVAEETLRIAQTFELGDKRLKRLKAGNLEASVAVWDYEAQRLAVAARAATAFIDVLAAQGRIEVLERFIAIAGKTVRGAEAQLAAGKGVTTDVDRAKIALARAKGLSEAERARLDSARLGLSSLWGADNVAFGAARGELASTPEVPTLAQIETYLSSNPAFARWSDEIGRRSALLDVEKAKAIPDIKVALGIRHFHEDDAGALVASVAVPLQIFDRNNGNIAAAGHRVERAGYEEKAARQDIMSALVAALGELRIAKTQISSAEAGVLPPVRSTFERTRAGYDEGRFDLFSLLDAQRSLQEAELDLITARGDYAKARVKVEMLIGRGLEEVK